ncbi:MAG: L-lysine 6-transaminase [Actinomycetota bacterium]|nr:L-lysine 6-transaminase [Actinomycetota bacterium]
MVDPRDVLRTLGRHLLTEGFDFVLDTTASHGVWLVDARDGSEHLDLFSFFASNALGMNHPALAADEEFRASLTDVALNKPSNSDIYSVELARFTDTFERVLGDPALPRYFFIEGGAMAVENALKVAFDWKSQRNEQAGRSPDLGTRVLHLQGAFHGRSGYTMSITDTEPMKTARFPRFDWPRVPVPAVRFPLDDHLAEVEHAEERALQEAAAAFARYAHDIACFIAEPIQGEGGDNHMRGLFLQRMQDLCHEHDALFVLDEVQTGVGLTGSRWCYEQLGLEPDIVAYGKKVHVGGIMAGRRVEEVAWNALRTPSRLNSTFGGNLTDMVRATRILEVLHADRLAERAAASGKVLVELLTELAAEHPQMVGNVRGRGLMCAFDLPDRSTRDAVRQRLFDEERVMMLGCGERSLRFRPPLTIEGDELRVGVDAIDRILARL